MEGSPLTPEGEKENLNKINFEEKCLKGIQKVRFQSNG